MLRRSSQAAAGTAQRGALWALLDALGGGAVGALRLLLHVCAIPFRPLPRATIGTQITLLSLVTTIPFLVLIIAWSVQDTQGARRRAEQSLLAVSQLGAVTMQAQLLAAREHVEKLAVGADPRHGSFDVSLGGGGTDGGFLWLRRLAGPGDVLPAAEWVRVEQAARTGRPVAAGEAAPADVAGYLAVPVPDAPGQMAVGALSRAALANALAAGGAADTLALVDPGGTIIASRGSVERQRSGSTVVPVAGTDWRVVSTAATAQWPGPDASRTILGLLWATVAAICLGVLSHRRLSLPIGQLASTAQRIGLGEFSVRAPFERGDELGELAGAMDAMTTNLERLTGELREARDRMVNTIAEVGRLATSDLDAEESWPLLAEISQHLTAADGSALYAREGSGALRLSATVGLSAWPERGDLAHRLASVAAPGWDAAPVRADRRMAVPIYVNQETAGVLEVFRVEAPFPPGTDRLLAVFARQAGLAIERIYLRRQAAEALAWEQTSRTQNEFIALASHELCAPMASLRSYAEALRRPDVLAEEADRAYYLERVEHLSGRLGEIVRNLLSVSRIRSGQLRVRVGLVDIAGLLRGCVSDTRQRAAHVQFQVDAPANLPLVLADPVCLEEIVLNLLGNAIRFSPPERPVHVWAEEAVADAGLRVRLHVHDEGPGLSREQQGRLFQRYGRLHPEDSSSGLGLGLYICQAYAKAMQGGVWVASDPGKGATFTVDLPAALRADGGPGDAAA